MNWKIVIITGAVVAASCFGESTIGLGELRFIERLAVSAKQNPSNASYISALERIVEGKPEAIDPQILAASGNGFGPVQIDFLKSSSNREHALQNLAETGLALDYLSAIRQEDLTPDDTGRLWPVARSSLQRAEFLQLTDRQKKIEFLEKVIAGGPGREWALNELCDHNILLSIPVIRESIKNSDPSQAGEDQIAYCEQRMAVIASNPDRTKALGSVLQTGDTRPSTQMILWAIDQLDRLNTTESKHQLDQFSNQIRQLPDGSAAWKDLSFIPRQIEILQSRPKWPSDPMIP